MSHLASNRFQAGRSLVSRQRHKKRSVDLMKCLALWLTAFPLLAATCTGPAPIDLDLDRGGRLMPSGRVAFEIMPGNGTRRRGALIDVVTGAAPIEGQVPEAASGRKTEFTLSVVAEATGVDGRDEELIPTGRDFDFNVTVSGPANISADIDNVRGHLAVRPGVRFSDVLSIEGIFGLGLDETETRIRSGAVTARDGKLRVGGVAGLRVSVRPIPLFDLYGQATVMLSEFFATDVEAGGMINLTPNLGVYGGYRRWDFSEENPAGRSDLDFTFDGPTVGMSLHF